MGREVYSLTWSLIQDKLVISLVVLLPYNVPCKVVTVNRWDLVVLLSCYDSYVDIAAYVW